LAALAAGLTYQQFPSSPNRLIYDGMQRTLTQTAPEDIIIIGVDEASLRGIGKWPWRRDIHAKLLDILTNANVKAVAFDIMFAERDTPNPAYDALLVDSVRRSGKTVLPVFMSEVKRGGQAVEVLPFNDLANAATELAHVHIEIDEDGICRSVFLREGLGNAYWPHFAVALYKIAYGEYPDPLPGQRADDDSSGNMAIVRDYLNGIRFSAGPGGFRTISYIDVLDGRFPAELLTDKIIFIGVMASGLADTLATPVSEGHRHMQGVEINANIFHALRSDTLITPLSAARSALIAGIFVFCAVLLIATVRPATSLLATLIMCLACLGGSYMALYIYSIWMAPAAATGVIALSYPLWSWRRLDRSMRYLRSEIAAYENESNLLDDKPPVNQLQSSMGLASQWLPIKRWDLQSKPASKLRQQATQWQFKGQDAAFEFQNGGLDYRIDLQLASQAEDLSAAQRELLEDISKPWHQRDTSLPKRNIDIVAYYIDQIKRSQANRRQLRHFIFSCLSNLQDGVIATSPSSRVILINEQARSLLGIAEDKRIDQTFFDLLCQASDQEESFAQQVQSVYREGKATQFEVSNRQKAELLVQGRQFELENADDRVVIFTLTDISKLKEMERTRAETLSFVSHDLRSPLVSILAIIDNAQSGNDDTIPNIRRYAERALSYTESFLQLARAEADNISFYECDLHSIVDNAREYVYELAGKKQINISANHCDEDAWIWGNGDLLERMVINLLDNAIKYSGDGTEVNIALKTSDTKAIISISDQGIGIPKEDIPLLFEQFHRGSSEDSRAQRGAGLGLRFIAVTLQRHSGDIHVSSELGKGSTFTVTLDLMDIEEE
jgi:PAS domain S-box-containing protein